MGAALMQFASVFLRWIDILARLLLAWRDRSRGWRVLRLAQDGDQWAVQQVTGQQEMSLGSLTSGSDVPAEIARAAQRSFVVLKLSAAEVISRRVTVPAQAKGLLAGIVQNQIERLSPWRADDAAFGFDARTSADAANLDVDVLITPRAALDETCRRLEGMGLRVDRVVAAGRTGDAAASVTLWSRLADATDKSLARARLAMMGIVAATVCITAAVGLWAFLAATSADGEADDLAADIAKLQRSAQGGSARTVTATTPPAERAWVLKETSPAAVVVVEALSRSLPDTSYLTDLNLEGAGLRIVGLADDAPSLIAPLEKSGHLTDVRFFAPTTRAADGRRFVFHIEARIEPHPRIEGD
jgi:general secretion pathway protein L